MTEPTELPDDGLEGIAAEAANAFISEMLERRGYSNEDVARIAAVTAVKIHYAMYNSPGGIENLRDTIDRCEAKHANLGRDSWLGHKKGPKHDKT